MDFFPIRAIRNVINSAFSGKDRFTQTPVLTEVRYMGYGKEPQWVSVNGEEAELFNTTAHLQNVILKNGSMYSNGVYKHYQIKKDGSWEEIKNSEIVNRLENPNVLQPKEEHMIQDYVFQSVFGNSFQYYLKGFKSQEIPSAIWNLPPNFMKVVPTGKIYQQVDIEKVIEKYVMCDFTGMEEIFLPKDILHFRNTNPLNPLIGISPFVGLQMSLSNLRGALGYRNVLITERGAIGVLSNRSKDGDGGIPITPEDKKKIEQQHSRDYGIREGQSKIITTSATLDWQPFNFPTKDLMLFEEEKQAFNIIVDRFGSKIELFSNEKGSTFTNVEEAKKMVYQDTIIPFANNRTFAITKKLGLVEKNQFIDLDYSHIECLQQNEKDKAEIMVKKVDAYTKLKESGMKPDQIETITGISDK